MKFLEVLTTYNSLVEKEKELRKKVEEFEFQEHFNQSHQRVLNNGYSGPTASVSIWDYRGMLSEVEYLIEQFNDAVCFIKIPENINGQSL